MRRHLGAVLAAGLIGTALVMSATSASAAVRIGADSEYGDDGVVVLRSGSAVRDSEVDADGGIFTAGTVSTSTGVFWRVEHLDVNGDHDPGFGTGGVVMFEARNANAYFVGMELHDNGLYLVGSDGQKGFTVMRINPVTGRVDTTFARRGVARATLDTRFLVSIADFEIDDTSAGRIAVLGNLADPTSRLRVRSFVARFPIDPDTSNVNRGVDIQTVDVSPGDKSQNLTQMSIDNLGRAIVAGSRIAPSGLGQEMVVVRLHQRRGLDSSFAAGGVRIIQPVRGAVSAFSSIVVNDDDSLTLGGWTRTGTARAPVQSVVVVRVTSKGKLDPRFNNDGVARNTDPRFNDQVITDLLVRPDGSMVLSSSPIGLVAKPALIVSLTKKGVLDNRVGTKGVTPLVYVTGQRSWTQMMHLTDDHLYVLGGTAIGAGQPSGTIARFDLN